MKKQPLTLRIISPDGLILEKEELSAVNVMLQTNDPIGIHSGHAPLLAALKPGHVKYRKNDQEDSFEVDAGIVKVRDNTVLILTSGGISKDKPASEETYDNNYSALMNTLLAEPLSNKGNMD